MNQPVTTVWPDNMRPPDDEGDDWDRYPSQLAEAKACKIWEQPLEEIYESCSDERVTMWCEWIHQAVLTSWLEDKGRE